MTVASPRPMPTRLSNLRNVQNCEWDGSLGILEVTSPHALSQAAGYLKYINRKIGGVFFRGQPNFYETMLPSLYRGVGTQRGKDGRDKRLFDYLGDVSS